MKHATISSTSSYPEMETDLPIIDQATVNAGVQVADEWFSRPWNDGESCFMHLAESVDEVSPSHQEAFAAGYMGRIHQHLRAPRVEPGKQVISGSDEMTMVLFNMLKDVAAQSSKGKLKAKGFQARALMRRLEQLADAMHDVTDEMNGVSGGHHE